MLKTLPVKWLLSLLAASLVTSSIVGWLLHKKGIEDGINLYHQHCYQVGGIAINAEGQAVACKGLTQVPQEELKGKPVASSLFK